MQTRNRTQASGARPQPVPATHTLDSLAAMSYDELAPLYAGGRVPASMDALDGHPEGRMLAVRATGHGPVFDLLRRFAGAPFFPWGGKSFRATGQTDGTGINRVRLAPLGRQALFPFETHVAPSVMDGRDCVVLDYDLPDNPWLIRHIHDEVREVSPGLYLGPAMWKTAEGHEMLLWFALDTGRQARELVFA